MCDNCWNAEVSSFITPEEWNEFSLALSRKLEDTNLSHNSINHEHSIYECVMCSEYWKVKTPDIFPGGYLLKLKTTTGGKSAPSTIAIVIVIGVLAVLFAKLFQYIFGY